LKIKIVLRDFGQAQALGGQAPLKFRAQEFKKWFGFPGALQATSILAPVVREISWKQNLLFMSLAKTEEALYAHFRVMAGKKDNSPQEGFEVA